MDCWAHVAGYWGVVTTFFQPWGFVLASKKHDPVTLSPEEIAKRFADRGVHTAYYTPRFHQAVFTLPEWLHQGGGRILTDAEPFVWDA
jgi:spermidine synthase